MLSIHLLLLSGILILFPLSNKWVDAVNEKEKTGHDAEPESSARPSRRLRLGSPGQDTGVGGRQSMPTGSIEMPSHRDFSRNATPSAAAGRPAAMPSFSTPLQMPSTQTSRHGLHPSLPPGATFLRTGGSSQPSSGRSLTQRPGSSPSEQIYGTQSAARQQQFWDFQNPSGQDEAFRNLMIERDELSTNINHFDELAAKYSNASAKDKRRWSYFKSKDMARINDIDTALATYQTGASSTVHQEQRGRIGGAEPSSYLHPDASSPFTLTAPSMPPPVVAPNWTSPSVLRQSTPYLPAVASNTIVDFPSPMQQPSSAADQRLRRTAQTAMVGPGSAAALPASRSSGIGSIVRRPPPLHVSASVTNMPAPSVVRSSIHVPASVTNMPPPSVVRSSLHVPAQPPLHVSASVTNMPPPSVHRPTLQSLGGAQVNIVEQGAVSTSPPSESSGRGTSSQVTPSVIHRSADTTAQTAVASPMPEIPGTPPGYSMTDLFDAAGGDDAGSSQPRPLTVREQLMLQERAWATSKIEQMQKNIEDTTLSLRRRTAATIAINKHRKKITDIDTGFATGKFHLGQRANTSLNQAIKLAKRHLTIPGGESARKSSRSRTSQQHLHTPLPSAMNEDQQKGVIPVAAQPSNAQATIGQSSQTSLSGQQPRLDPPSQIRHQITGQDQTQSSAVPALSYGSLSDIESLPSFLEDVSSSSRIQRGGQQPRLDPPSQIRHQLTGQHQTQSSAVPALSYGSLSDIESLPSFLEDVSSSSRIQRVLSGHQAAQPTQQELIHHWEQSAGQLATTLGRGTTSGTQEGDPSSSQLPPSEQRHE